MPATQQMSSSPSRQGSASNQGSQPVVHYQSPTQITTDTINTITKALDENNFDLLRQIASINDDYKQLVESFTSKFVTNKRQVKMTQLSQQGPSSAKNTGKNVQSTSSPEGHQKINTQNANPGQLGQVASQTQGLAQRRYAAPQSVAQQVLKQVMTGQRPPFQQPMSPTYSEYSSDTTSSDEDMVGMEQQMNQALHCDPGGLRHLQPSMDNLQPQMQRLPIPVQKPLEQGLVMKQEDICKVQAAKNTTVRSILVGKRPQQQMLVAAGNMSSQQTLSGGQVAFAAQVQQRPRQKQQLQVVSGQTQMVQMQPRVSTSQQLNVDPQQQQQNVNPHTQVVHQPSQMVQLQGKQKAPVLMRRVAQSKKTGKGKKSAKQSAEGTDQFGGHVMSDQSRVLASQLMQSNTQPANHNGGMGIQIATVESLQTKGHNTTSFPGRSQNISGIQGMQQNISANQLNQQQLVAGKGTLAIRVSEMTTEGVQQQVQMALGHNVRVQMSPQKAVTQVINSTGLRQTAPRPMMNTSNIPQKAAVRPGNIQQQRSMTPQTAMPQQLRSDQRTQVNMYQQLQTSERRHDNLQTTAPHVRQPYIVSSAGQQMVGPRMLAQHLHHQTPMTNMQVNTTGQHVQMASEAARIPNVQNAMLRQSSGQQMGMRQQMQHQHVRSDGHQFVQQGNPAHGQGVQQFRGQLSHQPHHVQQTMAQSELMGQQHQFVNSTHSIQTNQSAAMQHQQVQHQQMPPMMQSDASQDSSSVLNTPPKSQQELQPPSTPNVTPPPSTKEPNIVPLSTSSDTNMCSVGRAGAQENLVKGQEYLIQYSNGKKVIGIWDGRFFKVKNPQSQEGGVDEPSPAASQSPASNSQPSMVGAAGDPEAMAGEGTVENKLKGNAVAMNMAAVNNVLKVGNPQSNGPRHSGPNLARRPLHEDSPVEPSTLYEVKRSNKRPPRAREEGKFAVCKNCGAYSADYDNCDSCHKPIPENAKLFKPDASPVGTASKKMRSEAEFPAGHPGRETPEQAGKSAKLLLLQTGANQETPIVDKKLFYGKHAAALVIAQAEANLAGVNQKTPGSTRGGRGKGKASRGRGKASKKSPQIETVTILSSDDDGDSGPHGAYLGGAMPFNTPVGATTAAGCASDQGVMSQAALAQQSMMAATPGALHPGQHPKAGLRYRMEDDSGKVVQSKRTEKPQKSQQQTSGLASQDLSTILVQLQSRSIRIGSYRGIPADHFKITVQGVQFTIAWGEDCLQIHIGSNEITKVVCHLGESMPCMFLDTTPTCAQRLRQALEMMPGKEPYYDPQSEDEVHKRITVIFENLGEMGIENYIRALFQVMQAGNPYFQKEGSLLEEIEYQQANEILIQSTPQAHLQLLTLGLAPGYPADEDEDDEPVDRSRSPSPARIFNGQIVKLFIYPPPPATGGITVTNEDLFCLNDGEFLNDVILDFYLKYISLTKLSEEKRPKIHVFSSFFYRRLTSKQAKRNEENISIQERRHSRVKTWTRHIDLFEKEFVIVPINESAHWYLAIICFPGLNKPVYHMDRTKSPVEVATPTESSQTQVTQKGDMLDTITEAQPSTQPKSAENMDTDENSTSASDQGVPTKRIQKQPCVMIFDSLAGPSRTSVIRTLREYLQVEWDAKKKEKYGERVFDKDTMRGANPKCPQQLNFSDCGIYVLQYVESFFENPPQDYNIPVRGLQDWFSEETALCKREDIRQLIVALQKQLNPGLQYDPAVDGCMVGGLEDEEDLPDLLKEGQLVGGSSGGQVQGVMCPVSGPLTLQQQQLMNNPPPPPSELVQRQQCTTVVTMQMTQPMETQPSIQPQPKVTQADMSLSQNTDQVLPQSGTVSVKQQGDSNSKTEDLPPEETISSTTINTDVLQENSMVDEEQQQTAQVAQTPDPDASISPALGREVSESQVTSVSTYSLPSGLSSDSVVREQQLVPHLADAMDSEVSSAAEGNNTESNSKLSAAEPAVSSSSSVDGCDSTTVVAPQPTSSSS